MDTKKDGDKTLQGKTFTGKAGNSDNSDNAAPAPEEKAAPTSLGVGFDQVIAALKAGKAAQRVQWKGTMSLVPAKDAAGKVVDLSLKSSHSTARAGLHNLDLLADDWKIIEI